MEICLWLLLGQQPDPGRFLMLPMIAIAVLFYFMLVRPEQQRRKQTTQMIETVKKNDRVVTVGGIHGTVVNAAPASEEVTIKVDENNNTRLRISRTAISRVITKDAESRAGDDGPETS